MSSTGIRIGLAVDALRRAAGPDGPIVRLDLSDTRFVWTTRGEAERSLEMDREPEWKIAARAIEAMTAAGWLAPADFSHELRREITDEGRQLLLKNTPPTYAGPEHERYPMGVS